MKIWQTKNSTTITRLLQGRSNVYLIRRGENFFMVDTGGQNRNQELTRALKTMNISKLDYLFLTHTHFDHAGNAHMVRDTYEARVIAHISERDVLEKGVSAIPKGANIFTKACVTLGGKNFSKLTNFPPCLVDITTEDTFKLPGWTNVYVIHTPGHTGGSQCIIIDNEYAIAGDIIFTLLPGTIYPPFTDLPQLLPQSWERLLQTDCHTFLPGHGNPCLRERLVKHLPGLYRR